MKIRNAVRIHGADLKKLVHNPITVIILIGLMVLPSLYAWINIYASWDPYGNTGNLKVAVINEDKGHKLDVLGIKRDINVGKDVITNLATNNKLGWVLNISKDEAFKELETGKIYSLIVIPESFSKDITSVIGSDVVKPRLYYYINEKLNPIASKITDSGANAIKTEIQDQFMEKVATVVVDLGEKIGINLEENYSDIEEKKALILALDKNIPDTNISIDNIIKEGNKDFNNINNQSKDLKKVNKLIKDLQKLNSFADKDITKTEDRLGEAQDKLDVDSKRALNKIDDLVDSLNTLREDTARMRMDTNLALSHVNDSIYNAKNQISDVVSKINEINSLKDTGVDKINSRIQDIQSSIDKDMSKIIALNQSGFLTQKSKEAIEKMMVDLTKLDKEMDVIKKQLESISNQFLTPANVKQLAKSAIAVIDLAKSEMPNIVASVNQLAAKIPENEKQIGERLSSINKKFEEIKNETYGINSKLKDINIGSDANKIENSLNESLNFLSSDINRMMNAIADTSKMDNFISNTNESLRNLKLRINEVLLRLNNDVYNKIVNYMDLMRNTDRSANIALDALNGQINFISNKLDYIYDKKGITMETLEKLKKDVPEISNQIHSLSKIIKKIDDKIDLKYLIRNLSREGKKRIEFFQSPVDLERKPLYQIENYGAGMTPFYTVLCLWVGCMLMTALISTKAKNVSFKFTPFEEYLGKMFLFLEVGLIQALIVGFGDLYLLKVHIVDKPLFMFVAFYTIVVFDVMVYSLVSLFGNVGKALGVILLVLQVAGSGGTFPIQVTPEFFRRIHGLLPFTYAIGAMREAVGGVTYTTLKKDLIILSIFLIMFFILGAVLKKWANSFLEHFQERLEASNIIGH